MLGNSSTIAWFYLNTAPPGWKALSTGADSVLAVSGGSGDYNVDGGNPDSAATWTIDGFGHVHDTTNHVHQIYDHVGTTSTANVYNSSGNSNTLTVVTAGGPGYMIRAVNANSDDVVGEDLYTQTTDIGDTGSGGASNDGTYRPKASVGKLFQLDTA